MHRRLWPAVARLAKRFPRANLSAPREVHTHSGGHTLRRVPFPRWVTADIKRRAEKLTEAQAAKALGYNP